LESMFSGLKSRNTGGLVGVMHHFLGDEWFAREALDLGFQLGIAGPITFKNSDALRDIVKRLDIRRLVLETDCPYASPFPSAASATSRAVWQ